MNNIPHTKISSSHTLPPISQPSQSQHKHVWLHSKYTPNSKEWKTLRSLEAQSIADGFGELFFYTSPDQIHTFCEKRQLPPHMTDDEFNFTDDTVQALCVVETLFSKQKLDIPFFTTCLVDRYFQDPERGYSNMTKSAFEHFKANQTPFVNTVKTHRSDGSQGNGTIMRIVPLGAWYSDNFSLNVSKAIDDAEAGALLTHGNSESAEGAVATTIASFHGDIGEPKKNLDGLAKQEQKHVSSSSENLRKTLLQLGTQYRKKYGFKFLLSARGKSANYMLKVLKQRLYHSTLDQEILHAKNALAEIASIRIVILDKELFSWRPQFFNIQNPIFPSLETVTVIDRIQDLLQKYNTRSISISIINHNVVAQNLFVESENSNDNKSSIKKNKDNLPIYQIASISKSFAAAFAIEYFSKLGISLDTPVNNVLLKYQSGFLLQSVVHGNPKWANSLTIKHLLNHTGLGMHYVQGLPIPPNYSPESDDIPSVTNLITGAYAEHDPKYQRLFVEKEPGKTFGYSGGGFMVLQHLIETIEQCPIHQIMKPWITSLGISNLYFCPPPLGPEFYNENTNIPSSSANVIPGFTDSGVQVPPLQFPALAAGGWGSSATVAQFLTVLNSAVARSTLSERDSLLHDPFQTNLHPHYISTPSNHIDNVNENESAHSAQSDDHQFPISSFTALEMLHAPRTDTGSRKFIAADMGLGIFVTECGRNRICLHQAANDGYRGLFLNCFKGPNRGQGFVIFANGDNNATLLLAEVSQLLLHLFDWHGVDMINAKDLVLANVKQESIINASLKKIVFDTLTRDVPEVLDPPGPTCPLSRYNLARDAELVSVTNDKFARATNLVLPSKPAFDPTAFGRHGKIMDSWESSRHNIESGFDWSEFRLRKPSCVSFVNISTQFHDGNHAQSAQLLGKCANTGEWITIVPPIVLPGHSIVRYTTTESPLITSFRLILYPDGGISRLTLLEDSPHLPPSIREKFSPTPGGIINFRFPDRIPPVIKTVHSYRPPGYSTVLHNWKRLSIGQPIDFASAQYGGRVLFASNQHYGPATSIIAPFAPHGMFDGFESSRSRNIGHVDYVVVSFMVPCRFSRISFDFTHFVHNNPRKMSILAFDSVSRTWDIIVNQLYVKPFAGHLLDLDISKLAHPKCLIKTYSRVTIISDPDGGYSRAKFYGFVTREQLSLLGSSSSSSSGQGRNSSLSVKEKSDISRIILENPLNSVSIQSKISRL